MKLKFKHQAFQEEAVNALCDCFEGQPFASAKYLIDSGKDAINLEYTGFRNAGIALREDALLRNLKTVQVRHQLPFARELELLNGKPAYTVEMETGTGKTYVYIKTMYELAKRYGWTKFIIVVPSIAIREGVLKTFQITDEHFAGDYGRRARFFVYNSSRLNELEQFASDSGINAMIINTQAFNARGADARRIDMKLDSFQSRKPIDVVAAVNPIVIIDEPQSVLGTDRNGNATRESVKKFNPLFYITYSATHRENFNRVYRLDAVDAYQKQLVKKIIVKGITIKGSTGTSGYLYLQRINMAVGAAPTATVEFECNSKTSPTVRRVVKTLSQGDNIYPLSGGLEVYKNGWIISGINGAANEIELVNGMKLSVGECVGESNADDLRRIQIRETIASHLEKERALFRKNIKVLSLFFIDEVEKYRTSNRDDAEKSFYAETFENEYKLTVENLLAELPFGEEKEYRAFLEQYNATPSKVHAGYFSGDPKTGKFKNSEVKRGESDSDDKSAYDLIMRDKERLLSFDEPVRFIFSHSALKEGWDNPNVFQICTLRDTTSEIRKRQSIGRGLRLSVNDDGERQDAEVLQDAVQEVNALTVIANESYETFAAGLQSEYDEVLKNRPKEITIALFKGRTLVDVAGKTKEIDDETASDIYQALKTSRIIENKQLTGEYLALKPEERKAKVEMALPPELKPFVENIIRITDLVYSGKDLKPVDARKRATLQLDKKKFASKEFKELWKRINAKSFYTVRFDEGEFVKKAVAALDKNLVVSQLSVQITSGTMQANGGSVGFDTKNSRTENLNAVSSGVKYDLIGDLTDKTGLTRKCVGEILRGVTGGTFGKFKQNPEEFVVRAARLIDDQKASTIIEHITYNKLSDTWNEEAVFSEAQISGEYGVNVFDRTGAGGTHLPLQKHLFDKLRYDSAGERKLAEKLDAAEEVELYIKLPGGFYIHTPLGKYNPDWAISLKENGVRHIYFVAESKFYDSLEHELRNGEKAKIECARKHFAAISNTEVRYDVVDSFETLLNKIRS
ncbi:MAG: DEAD/DEAH box helicase family protein [Opitutaceae bacterium]|jgi:type III restriction enzyme|nr:DEAD/DEAH box helicase family protein [Opitutaceae bacterium]